MMVGLGLASSMLGWDHLFLGLPFSLIPWGCVLSTCFIGMEKRMYRRKDFYHK